MRIPLPRRGGRLVALPADAARAEATRSPSPLPRRVALLVALLLAPLGVAAPAVASGDARYAIEGVHAVRAAEPGPIGRYVIEAGAVSSVAPRRAAGYVLEASKAVSATANCGAAPADAVFGNGFE